MTSSRHKKRPTGKTITKPQGTSSPAARLAESENGGQRRQLLSWLGAGLVIAILAVAALIVLNNRRDDGDAGGPGNLATVMAGQPFDSSIQQDGMLLGHPDAPILVVEYGDYQCPHCTRFHRESMDRLIREYIQTGLIKFEFHEFPVLSQNADGSYNVDGESFRAAEAALCANDQGQYWPYHDALYANLIGISE